MELRHLRYFIAVVEAGGLTAAAERQLHTSQPSLSRQIRDLEHEVGALLLTRTPHGVEPTPAGRAFLDHARLAVAQANTAVEAARRAARPDKPAFRMGFLIGEEVDWLAKVTRALGVDLTRLELRVSSGFSPQLAEEVEQGKLDVAIIRREPRPELAYRLLGREPIVAILPSDHALATLDEIDVRDLKDDPFIGFSDVPHILRGVVDDYLERCGTPRTPVQVIDSFAMGISLVASIRGFALLPAYAANFLPWSVVSRPLKGVSPTIDLVLAYHRANSSPVLQALLGRLHEAADSADARA
ncbi:MAG TPA: LysR family transcriptional regulator [Caulobacteraceae bacterium]|jgi:LysR family hca operon transcriptional activator|nr:LysR family transcriptional regulator [Caulobacteraceae bacterium]